MNRKGAMEMSVGTIVTIVLLVTVLVLGLVLVRTIFGSGTDAVENIDAAIQEEISKLFADENKNLIVYPSDRSFDLNKGDSPRGFAFSVRNNDVDTAEFSYTTQASDVSRCGTGFNVEDADNLMIASSGRFSLGPGNKLDLPRLVKFDIPESTPPCTIVYELEILKNSVPYSSAQIFVTIR